LIRHLYQSNSDQEFPMRASLLSLALGGVLSMAASGMTPALAEGAADGDSAAVPDARTEPYAYRQYQQYQTPSQVVIVPPATTYVAPAPAYAGPPPAYAAPGSTTTYVSPNGTTTTTSTTYGAPVYAAPAPGYYAPGTTTYAAPSTTTTYVTPANPPLADYSQAQPKWGGGYDMHRPGVVPNQ